MTERRVRTMSSPDESVDLSVKPVPERAPVLPIGPRKRTHHGPDVRRRASPAAEPRSTLWYGDNLTVLREEIPSESVDLVYLDPPFNSNRNYNVLFRGHNGKGAPAQIQAFDDTWHWNDATRDALRDLRETTPLPVQDLMDALYRALGENDITAYLVMMTPRLVELHRVLKPSGSLYLHCDPTASHYLKIMLDTVFGKDKFRNEIVWRRYGTHNDVGQGSRHWGRVHDSLLFYVKDNSPYWNQMYRPLSDEYVASTYRHIEPESGRRYTTTPLTGPGGAEKGNPVFEWNGHTRAWRYSKATMERLHEEGRLHYSKTGYVRKKLYLDESKGVPVQDWWDDIPALSGSHVERMGYPTQKPLALLERIIGAGSAPDDLVLDPFCGCGTAVAAAEKMGRCWIGIDITSLATSIIENRMDEMFEEASFQVKGLPEHLDDAIELAKRDPFQFQCWIAGRIHALPQDGRSKKGADRGIDGIIPFSDDSVDSTKRCIVSVKSGQNIGPSMVRDLLGTVVSSRAEAGVFVTLKDPTPAMRKAAAEGGLYHSPLGRDYPKIQILTVEEILNHRLPDLPSQDAYRRRQRRIAAQKVEQQRLLT
jgi:DNA modification methylase